MPASPWSLPLPPPDFQGRALPLEVLAPGTRLYRIVRRDRGAIWFGPAAGQAATNRFDDPLGQYRVCYLGLTSEAALAETLLRDPPVRIVSRKHVDAKTLATLVLRRAVTAAMLHDHGLARLGATAAVAAGPHEPARAWSRAVWAHGAAPDGLTYRARHDDAQCCLALFDRARDALDLVDEQALRMDRAWLGSVLDRYALGLDS